MMVKQAITNERKHKRYKDYCNILRNKMRIVENKKNMQKSVHEQVRTKVTLIHLIRSQKVHFLYQSKNVNTC